ncbi:MAG: hypothetical protein CSA58_12660 [Micrococcales bacterium]|nr:MAG: hypothetical protein CSA58_12660 [Micrococcales bacterium]
MRINRLDPPSGDAVHVWYADLDTAHCHGAAPLDALSADERQRAARYRDETLRRRAAIATAVLRTLLGGYLGVAPAGVAIERRCRSCGGPHGALHAGLPGAPETLDVSTSRSGPLTLYAVSPSGRVGVDVELRDPAFDWATAARTAFHAEEISALGLPASGGWSDRCFELWTRKEAYLKAIGTGLAAEPSSVMVPRDGWTVAAPDVGAGYAAALVAEGSCTITVTDVVGALTPTPGPSP